MTQRCHAIKCEVDDLPDDKPFCGPHWHLVPPKLQNRFYHAHTGAEKVSAIAQCAIAIEEAEFGRRLL